jgi:hypothetical protein
MPTTDQKIPYFLTWAVEKEDDAEAKAIQAENKQASLESLGSSLRHCRKSLSDQSLVARILDDIVNVWRDTYSQVGIYQKAPEATANELDSIAKTLRITKSNLQQFNEITRKASNETESELIIEQFFQASMHSLEAFCPRDSTSPVIEKFHGAMVEILTVSCSLRFQLEYRSTGCRCQRNASEAKKEAATVPHPRSKVNNTSPHQMGGQRLSRRKRPTLSAGLFEINLRTILKALSWIRHLCQRDVPIANEKRYMTQKKRP